MRLDTIQSDTWKLDIAPEAGASVTSLCARIGGQWHPVMRESPESSVKAGNSSDFSSFTMAPFSNRIKDARFAFGGETYQLRVTTGDGNTQHGDVRKRPWKPLKTSAQELEYELVSSEFADFNFPFPFRMTVRYEVAENNFDTHLTMENIGTQEMPAGFGIHPYFRRIIADSGEMLLGFHAGGLYETGDRLIPTGKVTPVPKELDFSTPRAVGALQLDHGFREWGGRVSLTWPNIDFSAAFECDPIFSHLIVFTQTDGSVAVEPVTNATDGFNLMAHGVGGHGVVVLKPGESVSGRIRLART